MPTAVLYLRLSKDSTASDDNAVTVPTATVTPTATVSERRAIVSARRADGVAPPDIAAELSVSARTVHRDIAALT
ncbi:DNA-binding NarL/FixJ family response regulator [Streptomonospora salina]|uniref:DNA-binding NarL/FixJ family response regulator n=1 Tax=Streptomonospora salina TaxID=104205 RepID=A0A841E3H7_9ACTN|nr:DNA-binding NarL/FixJ family response regulator [Streptomonospora salina]